MSEPHETRNRTPEGACADPERRRFLAGAAAGAAAVTLIPVGSLGEEGAGEGKPKWAYLVDTRKCIGCGRCMLACHEENQVPDQEPGGGFRTWVERYVHYKDGRVEVDVATEPPYCFTDRPQPNPDEVDLAYFVPKLCNHCENTPCIQVCPVGASYMTEEGVVLVDKERCIGCSYCIQACPFGTRFINPRTNTADKCTWCYHRITKGLPPACVAACPTGARSFGDLNDHDSEFSKRMRTERIDVLKSYLGTRPRTRYIGLTSEVV